MTDAPKISLNQQIAEVEHEIKMRKQVYPRLVGSGKMAQRDATWRMAAMEATLATLKWLQTNADAVKAAVRGVPE